MWLRAVLLFIFMVASFGTSGLASDPPMPPSEIQGAIEVAFQEFQKEAAKNPQKYGFASASAVEKASVEYGYPIYQIDEKTLKNFKGNIYQLETYAKAWDFVVFDAQNEARAFIEIEYSERDKTFYMARFGGDPAPLLAGEQAVRAFAGNEAKNMHLVKFAGQRLLVFEFKQDGKFAPFVIPLTEDTTAFTKPLDYRQTIEYLKKINGYEYSESMMRDLRADAQINWEIFVWLSLFAVLMIIIVRVTNKRLRKQREEK